MKIIDNIKKKLVNNYIGLLLIVILILLFVRSYNFTGIFGFIDFGFSFLDIKQAIYNNLFVWGDKRSFGENQFNFIFDIFEYFLYFILITLGIPSNISPGILQLITILVLPVLFFVNIKFISEIIYKKKIHNNYYWIFSFLPIFTLGFFNEQWHILFSQRYAWIVSLILFYYLNKYIYLKKGKIGLLIASFFSIFAFNLFPFFLAFHIIIFFYILFQIFSKNISFKKSILLYFIYTLLTFFAWFNILYLYGTIDFSNTDAVKYGSDLKTYVSYNNHLDNLFRGVFQLIWGSTLGWDSSSQTFPYQTYFLKGIYSIIVFLPFVLFFIFLILYKNTSKINKLLPYLFVLFFIIAIFIAKGNNAPLGNLFIDLLDQHELLNIYRSPANKFMPIFYTFFTFSSFIFFLFIKDHYKKYFGFILVIYYLIFIFPIFITGFYSKYSFFKLPTEYTELKSYLEPYNGRILFLPERDYGKKYKFGAHVNSINYFNIKNTTFDIGQTLLSNSNVGLSKNLLNSVNFFGRSEKGFNSGDIYQRGYEISHYSDININNADVSLSNSKIDFIIFDKNLIGTFNANVFSNNEIESYNYLLNNLTDFRYDTSLSGLAIYKRTGNLYGSNIINYNGSYIYRKISPVIYKIVVNISGLSSLGTYQSFDKGWKLYLEPFAPLDCGSGATAYSGATDIPTGKMLSGATYIVKSRDDYARIARAYTGLTVEDLITLNPDIDPDDLKIGMEIVVSPPTPEMRQEPYHVTECPSQNSFYAGGELAKLWEKPIFDDTHRMVYDYANQWTIDPEYIKANYSREYYRINPDGTMDVRMTMYFRPQSYFYLGLIISGVTLFGCITYLVVSGVRGRRRRTGEGKRVDFSREEI